MMALRSGDIDLLFRELGYSGEDLAVLKRIADEVWESDDRMDNISFWAAYRNARCGAQRRQMFDTLLWVKRKLKLKIKTLSAFADVFYVVLKDGESLKKKHLKMLAEYRRFLGVHGYDGQIKLTFELILCASGVSDD